ncbi:MAG: S-layer homology domain-containing protein [Pegethrix bostrychoides GSE-TBD4-15B]|jgi:hypothetical protein|uniref:S-layer homology domain-containing protein n=1 Tax=Pegethrix bostrychoides GSE-TBD4-15B TaxID=2839662 RepID=A0A951PEY7_9CYAN|nr:S-layer homology domain-containing protein [Pegethrix bostrychoides GSE-TBD4-15B]
MNTQLWHGSIARNTAITLSLVAGVVSSTVMLQAPVLAQDASFPDTQDYWGQPFIAALAERDIVTGYLDNTYRPEQTVNRDEFAAILQKAFSQPSERQISSGSAYTDIPEGYWAASAIESAYEMGFMKGYPEGDFRPNQPVTKVEALASLAQNLNLSPVRSEAAPAAPAALSQQPAPQRRAKRPLMFPLAMTTLMQPLVKPPVRSAPVANSAASAQSASSSAQQSIPIDLSNYYQDAAQIPQYAVGSVAETTAANIVVNYPDPQILNPTQPATRGEIAALIHQALVYQGKMIPLPSDEAATRYVVGR